MARFLLLYVVLAFVAGPQLGWLSGRDTALRWIVTGVVVLAAAIGAMVWRIPTERVRGWLYLALRFSLAITMLVHGVGQLIPTAIPEPALSTFTRRVGELTREQMLATFLGASVPYQAFNGVIEVAAGLLLLFPVTALLGAVIAAGMLSMAVVMAFCYDVPHKLVTMQALLLALLLVAPHARRLLDVLLFNRVVEPADEPPAPRAVQRFVVACGLAVLIVLSVLGAVRFARARPTPPPLYGAWNVEELTVGGQELAPGDPAWWRWVIVERDGRTRIVPAMGAPRALPPGLRLVPAEAHVVTVQGSVDGAAVRAKLRRMELLQENFHWLPPPDDEE